MLRLFVSSPPSPFSSSNHNSHNIVYFLRKSRENLHSVFINRRKNTTKHNTVLFNCSNYYARYDNQKKYILFFYIGLKLSRQLVFFSFSFCNTIINSSNRYAIELSCLSTIHFPNQNCYNSLFKCMRTITLVVLSFPIRISTIPFS
jgi:hypothetical protein